MSTEYKQIAVVDEKDVVIGSENLMVAINTGAIFRVVGIFVFDEAGKLLLQRRSRKVLQPCKLGQSSSGHVDAGEEYKEAAIRELSEELGIVDVQLETVVTSVRFLNYFYSVYRVVISKDTKINYNTDEISGVYWMDIPELEKQMKLRPEEHTKALLEVWGKYRDKIIPS